MAYSTVSIIIPAYNEENTIESIIDRVRAVELPQGLKRQIIVVDDGSTDATATKVTSKIAADVILIRQANAGKTGALLTGFRQAMGDILLVQDADLEYDPKQYPHLLEPILKGETNVVYGSRFLGHIENMQLINRLANLISNWTFRLLYRVPMTDINTCYKVFTKEAFQGIDIVSKGFAFETELTIKLLRKGEKIVDVPIGYQARSREAGKKIRWSTALEMFWPIIHYRFTRSS